MKNGDFVSIIIPTKNAESVIGECLTAIQNLNTPADKYEVIIVDNNSADRTVEIEKQFDAVILRTNSEKVNVSGSRNIGAKQAKGDILAFLDADCIVSKEWLNNALINFKCEDTCLAGYKYKIPENSTLAAKSWDFIFANREMKGTVDWVPAGNMFILKRCFESVGGFDESLVTNEDVELCYRLKEKGYQILSDPKIQVTHLGTPQTYYELYKKELWHGIGAFQTFMNDLRRVRNFRPVIFALFYAFGLIVILFTLVISLLTKSLVAFGILIAIILFLLVVPFTLSLSLLHRRGGYKLLFSLTMVYLTYGVARSICLFRFLSDGRKK